MKKLVVLVAIVLSVGCKSDVQLSMERGIQFYEWNLYDKALLEFNQVILMLPSDPRQLTYEETEMLSRAYYNIAISHLQLGRNDQVDNFANKAYQLLPTQENWDLLNNIRSQNN
tara:strand:- start:1815 stop:2156 length:342 start_codon:yes stop_codon:yes gene_type:complete